MELTDRRMTLEQLLTQIVTSEIQAFGDRQSERRITKVLGLVDIEAGAV